MIYFVHEQHGNDSNSGCSKECAFKTKQAAKAAACIGDTIYTVANIPDEDIFDSWWNKNEQYFCENMALPKDLSRISFMAGIACIEEGWQE